MRYYPVFLDVAGKHCVIAGGGKIAERKISALLKSGARITVISPKLTNTVSRLKESNKIKHIARDYRKGDLKGAFIAIAATDSAEINEKISRDADALGIPVNVVDRPRLCSFIVPSVIERGGLEIAVSTSGISPALSRSIRLELESLYGKEFGSYLRKLSRFREKALKEVPPDERRKLFKRLGSGDIIRAVRAGKKIEFPAL